MSIPDRVLDHLCDVINHPQLSGTRYEILNQIGQGGMGAVYRVRDTQLDREVALKVIDISSSDGEATLAEARLLARLEHPGIVTVHDAGILPDGRAFCVMRCVDGIRLDCFLAESPTLYARLNVLAKLCDAVAFAHSRGVIHRDLKPENVMSGSFGEVVVLDWGVALWTRGVNRTDGAVVGTVRYMAPEQANGGEVDFRSDIYALGVLMDELLPPFCPRPLTAIAAKARSRDREKRYASVEEMAKDVQRYQDRLPVSAYKEPMWERAVRYANRNRVLVLLISTYVIVRVVLFFLRPR